MNNQQRIDDIIRRMYLGQQKTALVLLQNIDDIHELGSTGQYILYEAIFTNSADVVEYLLKIGAQLHHPQKQATAEQIAIQMGNSKIIDLIVKK